MNYKSLKLDISEKVALVTLSQPKKFNSMTLIFWQEILDVFNKIENSDARVAIINAEGKHFSSGIDLNEFASLGIIKEKDVGRNAENIRKIIKKLQESFNVIENSRVPVLAAIHGACIGGAVDLISACDIRFGTTDSFFS
ncbi:MAG: Methylthioacryloyl-CoA hydratase, partial [Alphaproteobacteria bacterium MarineAlpha2_Bin1]